MNKVYNFHIDLNWKLITLISKIDRFDASWSSIEKREGQSLKQLKAIATVRSVGASTRIEGSLMSDEEVDVLLNKLDIEKLEERDAQEVAGYFEALDLIADSFKDIPVSESALKNLHKILLQYSSKDEWHRGGYKQHENSVEATLPDGTKQIIFRTTPPGYATNDSMQALIEWYANDNETHSLVKCAIFTYEFLSIHPFQDGNGRLSRLISILLLLKNGYAWVEYISLEHEIESRKDEYYRELRHCQAQRPNENVSTWIQFFLDALGNIQQLLLTKLETQGTQISLSPREKSVLTFIGHHPGSRSGEIAKKLNIPNPTVKRMLSELVEKGLLEKYGSGPGTNYSIS